MESDRVFINQLINRKKGSWEAGRVRVEDQMQMIQNLQYKNLSDEEKNKWKEYYIEKEIRAIHNALEKMERKESEKKYSNYHEFCNPNC
mmetsp:Transcript_954/g.1696  ORF Transcript_954/g.1696 Transcript_954/m.1696 type:complete len:89 (+) Transcript_954:596-862(+)